MSMISTSQVYNTNMKSVGAADNTALIDLSEKSVLDNISERYLNDEIYTYTSHVLLSVNPFKQIDSLYGTSVMDLYRNRPLGALPPHPYALGDIAARRLTIDEEDQAIVVSGESGAGKTETAKHLLAFLTHITSSTSSGESHKIGEMILSSNPILEAFGNACTVRNANSSRFGKLNKLFFEKRLPSVTDRSSQRTSSQHLRIRGASIASYLLEGSRILSQPKHERNFHIFFQMLAGLSDDHLRALYITPHGTDRRQTWKQFYLLNPDLQAATSTSSQNNPTKAADTEITGIPTLSFEEDCKRFSAVRQSMRSLNFPPSMQADIFRLLAALLHLGQVGMSMESAPPSGGSTEETVRIVGMDSLQCASELLNVPAEQLHDTLTKRVLNLAGEEVVRPFSLSQARSQVQSLIRALYTRSFKWLVAEISAQLSANIKEHQNLNKSGNLNSSATSTNISGQDRTFRSVGILDIYGFERVNVNHFEQLLINAANERLQDFFVLKVLKNEQDVYANEGLEWRTIPISEDSRRVLDIIAGPSDSIFACLDDHARLFASNTKDSASRMMTALCGLRNVKASDNKTSLLTFMQEGGAPSSQTPARQFSNNGTGKLNSRKATTFTVRHYAGDVVYTLESSGSSSSVENASYWLEKNNDRIASELETLISDCAHSIVAMCTDSEQERIDSLQRKNSKSNSSKNTTNYNNNNASSPLRKTLGIRSSSAAHIGRGGSTGGFKSVARTFCSDLDELVSSLDESSTRFIRCFLPNRLGQPKRINSEVLSTQLKQSGTVDLVHMMSKGYPARVKLADLAGKYRAAVHHALVLAFSDSRDSMKGKRQADSVMDTLSSDRDLVEFALRALDVDPSEWVIGISRVFMRAGNYSKIDEALSSEGVTFNPHNVLKIVKSMRRKKFGRALAAVRFVVRIQIHLRKSRAVRKLTDTVCELVRSRRVFSQWIKPALCRIRSRGMNQQIFDHLERFGNLILPQIALRKALGSWKTYIADVNQVMVLDNVRMMRIDEEEKLQIARQKQQVELEQSNKEEIDKVSHALAELRRGEHAKTARFPPQYEGVRPEDYFTSSPSRYLRDNASCDEMSNFRINPHNGGKHLKTNSTGGNNNNMSNSNNSNSFQLGSHMFMHEPFFHKKDREVLDSYWRPDPLLLVLKNALREEMATLVFNGTHVMMLPGLNCSTDNNNSASFASPVKRVPFRIELPSVQVSPLVPFGLSIQTSVNGRLPAFSDGYFDDEHYQDFANAFPPEITQGSCNKTSAIISAATEFPSNPTTGCARFIAVEDDMSIHICELSSTLRTSFFANDVPSPNGSNENDPAIATLRFSSPKSLPQYPLHLPSAIRASSLHVTSYLPSEITQGYFRTLKACLIPSPPSSPSAPRVAILATPSRPFSFGRPIPRPLGLEASEIAIFILQINTSSSSSGADGDAVFEVQVVGKTTHQIPNPQPVYELFCDSEDSYPSVLGCLDIKPLASGAGVYLVGPGVLSVFTFRGLFNPPGQQAHQALSRGGAVSPLSSPPRVASPAGGVRRQPLVNASVTRHEHENTKPSDDNSSEFDSKLLAIDCVFAAHSNLPFDQLRLQWLTASHSMYHPAEEDRRLSITDCPDPWISAKIYANALLHSSSKNNNCVSSNTLRHPLQGLEEIIIGDATGRVRTFLFRHDDYAIASHIPKRIASRLLHAPQSATNPSEVASAAAPARLPFLTGGSIPCLPVFRLVLHCPWSAASVTSSCSSASIAAIIQHSSASVVKRARNSKKNNGMSVAEEEKRFVFSLVTQSGAVLTIHTLPIDVADAAKVATPELIAAARARLSCLTDNVTEDGSTLVSDPDDQVHQLETRPFFEGDLAVSAGCGIGSDSNHRICLWNGSEEVAVFVTAKTGVLEAFAEVREENFDEEQDDDISCLGNVRQSSNLLLEGIPKRLISTVTLNEKDEKVAKGTKLSIR